MFRERCAIWRYAMRTSVSSGPGVAPAAAPWQNSRDNSHVHLLEELHREIVDGEFQTWSSWVAESLSGHLSAVMPWSLIHSIWWDMHGYAVKSLIDNWLLEVSKTDQKRVSWRLKHTKLWFLFPNISSSAMSQQNSWSRNIETLFPWAICFNIWDRETKKIQHTYLRSKQCQTNTGTLTHPTILQYWQSTNVPLGPCLMVQSIADSNCSFAIQGWVKTLWALYASRSKHTSD